MGTRRNSESSEPEDLRVKVKKLEEKELMSNDIEWQLIEDEGHEVIDFFFIFMSTQCLKHIADKILSFLDRWSFANCRLVSRSWRDYIDGELPMLHLQIFHYYGVRTGTAMKKSTNKSDLLMVVNIRRQFKSPCYNSKKFKESPFEYMIDHHRHDDLKLLLDGPMEMTSAIVDRLDERRSSSYKTDIPSSIFKYACLYGCAKCVKLFLDRTQEKKIDLNYKTKMENRPLFSQFTHIFGHCLPVTYHNIEDYPHRNNEGNEGNNILMLLLSSAEEKGIDINGTDEGGKTLKEKVEESLWWDVYPQYVLDVLGIDPSKIQK